MRIQTFDNRTGLIHGTDTKRIGCGKEGVLKIGSVEVKISTDTESVMPLLFNGCSGAYMAAFTDASGIVYDLGKVEIKGGRIAPPNPIAVELMELRCKLEELEKICDIMRERISDLSNIFDTNSLNFLIR